ncbi:CRISPR-associated protein Cas4 [Agathobaculum sp. TL06]
MIYQEEDYLQLSGLQHFAFCRRQWALIHLENQWKDNLRTVEGNLFHHRAHDSKQRERRGNILILRELPICSASLGISGKCDVVEFHAAPTGIALSGEEGRWRPFPIEYKKGAPKAHQADELQLCAQALCLEEMLCCPIAEGALFYGETRRRCAVSFTEDLRQTVRTMLDEMHQLHSRGHTPRVKPTTSCNACSLKGICLPVLMRKQTVKAYLHQAMEDRP